MRKTLSLTNNISQVSTLAIWVEELGHELSLPTPSIFQLNLALEEAVVNVMKYAYPGKKNKSITLIAEHTANNVPPTKIQFKLIDEGVPFDPTRAQKPDVTLSAEKRNIGGLGIFLLQKIMKSVIYKRKGNKNILTMTYPITKEQTQSTI